MTIGPEAWLDAKRDFGALGNDTADDTAALDAAVAQAHSSSLPLWVPAGVYRRTTPWDLRSHGLVVRGAGTYWSGSGAADAGTVVKQMTANTPVMRVGRDRQHISGMLATYDSTVIPTSTDTNANAFEFYKSYWSVFENLKAYRVGRGFYIPQVDYANGYETTGNAPFSCEFNSCTITGFALNAISFDNFGGGGTGSVWNNTYISNNPLGTRNAPAGSTIEMKVTDEMVFNQLNIEWQLMQTASQYLMYFESGGNIVINGLHIEQISLEVANGAMLFISDGNKVKINGVCFAVNQVTNNGTHAFCTTSTDAYLDVDGFDQHDNTIAGSFVFLNASGATAGVSQARLNNAETSIFTAMVANEKAAPQQMLREVNGNRYAWQEGGCNVTTGTAAPSAGAWLRGDRCWNTTPSAAGVPGWVCTTAGSPGTWKAMAVVAA